MDAWRCALFSLSHIHTGHICRHICRSAITPNLSVFVRPQRRQLLSRSRRGAHRAHCHRSDVDLHQVIQLCSPFCYIVSTFRSDREKKKQHSPRQSQSYGGILWVALGYLSTHHRKSAPLAHTAHSTNLRTSIFRPASKSAKKQKWAWSACPVRILRLHVCLSSTGPDSSVVFRDSVLHNFKERCSTISILTSHGNAMTCIPIPSSLYLPYCTSLQNNPCYIICESRWQRSVAYMFFHSVLNTWYFIKSFDLPLLI